MRYSLPGSVLLAGLLPASAKLSVRGSSVYDGETRVKFKGIGLTCTEYMLKKGMDDASKGEHIGHWAYNYCFGGPPSKDAPVELNKEPGNILRYLSPDTASGSFVTKPLVKKIKFAPPYDKVVDTGSLEARPITRIPFTGSSYLYDDVNGTLYREILDKLVTEFTSHGVAVVLDMHWNCPDTGTLQPCTGAQSAPMALRSFGGKPGALEVWDHISTRYASNGHVMYELFNEPWIQRFDGWYAGDDTYAGMREMYETVRKNDPDGIVVIGGKDQYALDAQSGLAFYLQLKQDTGAYPHNVLWNVHPYVGGGQGLEHSLSSAVRLALALQTVGPVIFTEFGQYCCGAGSSCRGSGQCSDPGHGDHFVHNVVNMAEQYDISWVGWGWRGTNVNNANRPCLDGMAECGQPDIRDVDDEGRAVLADGKRAGADWSSAWRAFVTSRVVTVEDVDPASINTTDAQPAGFLPRPCIALGFNLGNVCGWDGGTDVRTLRPEDFTSQSIYNGWLPGLPGSCRSQGCAAEKCDTYAGPCHTTGDSSVRIVV